MSNVSIKPTRKPYRFKKRYRKIGPTILRKQKRAKPKVPFIDVMALDATNSAEPRDKFNKGLWACKTFEEVEALLTSWRASFNRKAGRGLGRRRVSEVRKAILKALLKEPGATSTPVLTSDLICNEAFKYVYSRLIGYAQADPEMEMVLVTVICGSGATSHYQTKIELLESQRKAQVTARAISPNFIGVTELALFNSHTHPSGGQLVQRHEHFLVWERGVVAKATDIANKHGKRFEPNLTGAPIIDVKKVATDPVNLARMAAYLFKPPYKCKTWNPPREGKDGHMSGSEKGDRNIRYLRLAQLRSMMTIEQITFGGGDGQSIRSDLIKFLRALAIKEAAGGRRVLHPDAIASFWVDLAKEIKADRWALPIIKTQS